MEPLRVPAMALADAGGVSGSYLGGSPPAIDGFIWPTRGERPLDFLACLDLSEMNGIDWLPNGGLLLFFYDIEEMPWGAPDDVEGWTVRYVPPGAAEEPSGDSSTAPAGRPMRHIRFDATMSAPKFDHPLVEALDLNDPERSAWIDHDLDGHGDLPIHQVGGFAHAIQGAGMELDCQLASNGVVVETPEQYTQACAGPLAKGADEWRLLFQMDSDDGLDLMWGDGGMLYWWVRERDAMAGDFSRVWLILQCY